MAKWIAVVVLFLFLAGCMSQKAKDDRVTLLTEQKVEAAIKEGKVVTPEMKAQFKDDAVKQVEVEIQKQKDAVIDKGGDIIGDLATGNWIKAGLGVVALIGIALGIKKKEEEPPVVKPPDTPAVVV